METAANNTESSVLLPLRPEPPVRILVRTLTHLVPGKDNYERTDFILNYMCSTTGTAISVFRNSAGPHTMINLLPTTDVASF
ncbi:hypothetical protein GJ744_008167 [Endocarpon pusillum]|uniref:Uncharacterized protein n=1 Tax=Endocarpon pusillum TaxID=364733 RepID=A0A8H7AHR5_9EURO|nr:hypothetical protein GJ744_008167 [Endocarpon pusillum]